MKRRIALVAAIALGACAGPWTAVQVGPERALPTLVRVETADGVVVVRDPVVEGDSVVALLVGAPSASPQATAPDAAAPSGWSTSFHMRRPLGGAFWSGKGHLGADVFFEGWGVGVTTSWARSGSARAESLEELREAAVLIRWRLLLGRRHTVTVGGGVAALSGSRMIAGSYRWRQPPSLATAPRASSPVRNCSSAGALRLKKVR